MHPACFVDRRRLLIGSAASIVLGQAPARAQQATAAPVNAGTYGFQIGEIRATVVSDGTISGNPRIYASTASQEDLQRALTEAFLPIDSFSLNLNALLLDIGGRKVLVEAGAAQTFGPQGGRLFANLASIGVRPNDIDVVVVSHTHPDHVGNLKREDGSAAFPKATVHVPAADWVFFVTGEPDLSRLPMNEEFRRRFIANIKSSVEPIAKTAVLYNPGGEILPGLTVLPASGHTPGMSALLVHSGREQLLITADAAYSPLLNLENPWRPGPDLDAEAAAQSRRRLFDRAVAERMLVLGFHFPFPGLGRIRVDRDAYRWVPAPWQFQP